MLAGILSLLCLLHNDKSSFAEGSEMAHFALLFYAILFLVDSLSPRSTQVHFQNSFPFLLPVQFVCFEDVTKVTKTFFLSLPKFMLILSFLLCNFTL